MPVFVKLFGVWKELIKSKDLKTKIPIVKQIRVKNIFANKKKLFLI